MYSLYLQGHWNPALEKAIKAKLTTVDIHMHLYLHWFLAHSTAYGVWVLRTFACKFVEIKSESHVHGLGLLGADQYRKSHVCSHNLNWLKSWSRSASVTKLLFSAYCLADAIIKSLLSRNGNLLFQSVKLLAMVLNSLTSLSIMKLRNF